MNCIDTVERVRNAFVPKFAPGHDDFCFSRPTIFPHRWPGCYESCYDGHYSSDKRNTTSKKVKFGTNEHKRKVSTAERGKDKSNLLSDQREHLWEVPKHPCHFINAR